MVTKYHLQLWFFSTNFHFEEYLLVNSYSFFSFFSISTTAAFTSQHQILSQDFHGSAIMKTKDNKNMKKSDYCVTPGCVKGGLISEDIFNLVPSSKKVSNHFPSSLRVLKSGNLKSTQILRLAILPPYLAIFSPPTYLSFRNLGAHYYFEGLNNKVKSSTYARTCEICG